MNFIKLMDTLTQHSKKELAFSFENGLIRKDYHITEILKTQVNAIDCGGAVDSWNETVLQLLEPKNETSDRFMSAEKALDILIKSNNKIQFLNDSNLVLEYRPTGNSATQRYVVSEISIAENRILVQAKGAITQCKAAVRKTGTSDSCGSKKQTADNVDKKSKSGCCA